MSNIALIIGAGPAGLTAACELLRTTELKPVVLERDPQVGGLSRTFHHNGYRLDLGGHRFFSRSDRVMSWWLKRLPLQAMSPGTLRLGYQRQVRGLRTDGVGPDPHTDDRVMLLRPRRSRILHRGKLFEYPLNLSHTTLRQLGWTRTLRIGASYATARLRPREENNLEDFLINRFGRVLYETFFESYSAKVWGRPCRELSAEWGSQRIKALDLRAALENALRRRLGRSSAEDQTSLIEQFLYPKFGPGQMWEVAAEEVVQGGGEVRLGWRVHGLERTENTIEAVHAQAPDGSHHRIQARYVLSTMPLRELIRSMNAHKAAPDSITDVTEGLGYRDFITVGVLLDRLQLEAANRSPITDNWLYVQDDRVELGRIQIYNNWSPWLVKDATKTWLGLEYFTDVEAPLWNLSNEAFTTLATKELATIGLARERDILDTVVLRSRQAYPGYFGTHDRLSEVQSWLNTFENFFPIGRNGMHRYNNQDHSMLSAMVAVESITSGTQDRSRLWSINAEDDFHERT